MRTINKIHHLIFLTFLVGIASCGYKNKSSIKDEGSVKLNVREIVGNSMDKHYLSNLTEEIKYIPLETDSSYLIKDISYLEVTKDHILVSDRKGVYQFNKKGDFIREIGREGNGPGEHNGMVRIALNKHQNELLIYCWGEGLINIHNLETGLFKSSFNIDFHVDNFVVMPGGEIAFFTPEFQFEINEVIFTDIHGNIKKKFPNMLRNNMRGNVSGFASLSADANHVYYLYNYRDTLYRINNKLERTPVAVFGLDNKESHNDFIILPNPEMSTYFPDFISIPHIILSDRFIFTTLQKGVYPGVNQELVRSLYDKLSGKLCLTEGFVNDIDGGMEFWPRWIKEGVLLDYYHPYQMLDHYNKTKNSIEHSNAFLEIVHNLDENDNPVLVFIPQQ